MEQLHDDIRQCCSLLDSNKITDRKKSCTELQDYLLRQDVKNLLNGNSERKNGLTWDTVLHTTFRGLLKEADRIRDDEDKGGKQSSKLDQTKNSFSGLMSTIVSCANAGGAQRLSIGPLLQSVLNILQEVFYRKHFGCTFLQILRFQILKCHNYCIVIGHDIWKDLLVISEQLYRNPPPRVDKCLILSTITMIIKKGGNHSFLMLEVKKKFPFIIECIQADAKTLNLQESLALLALTTCRALAYESRMAICKFGEEVMSKFREMYDFRMDAKKKDLLLKWFVLQVGAHHPCGVKRDSAVAYAGDWDAWLKQLCWLYQVVVGEIASVLRHRATRQLSPHLVTLAVTVFRQIFEKDGREILDMSLISNLADTSLVECNPSKRIRLESGVPALLDKLVTTPQQDMWPWLTIISATARQYPELISENDLVSLVQFCAEQLQTCKNTTTMDSLYRCCDTLLFVESKKNDNLLDITKLKELWDSVWETSLRALGLNLCEEWVHKLVQKLVLNTKHLQGPVERLVKLFVSGAVHRTDHSLNTLHCITARHCLLEALSVQECKVLVEWVLPSQEETPVENWSSTLTCSGLVAQVAVALVVNGKAPLRVSSQEPPHTSMTDVEQLYLITSFEGGLCVKDNASKPLSDIIEENKLSVDSTLVGTMMTLLTRDHFVVREKARRASCASAAVHVLSLHISLLCNIIKTVDLWQLAFDNRLEGYLHEACEDLAEAVKKILMNTSEVATVLPVLSRLRGLFQLLSTVSQSVSDDAASRLNTEFFIKGCFALVKFSQQTNQPANEFDFDEDTEIRPSTSSDEDLSPFEVETVTGRSKIQLEAYKLSLECSRWNVYILKTLLSLLNAEADMGISHPCYLQMALSAAKFASSLPSLPGGALEDLLDVLQRLCRQWHASDLGVLALLDILQDLCTHVHQSQEFQEKYTILVTGLLKFVKRKTYGAHVCCRFVQLLGHLAQVDQAGKWSIHVTEDGSMRPLTHQLITFINSPFHQVRMAACKEIWTLFTTSNPEKQQTLDTVLNAVNEVFLIQGNVQPEEELDEGVIRTATALHCLAAIAAVSTTGRSRTLLTVFRLTSEKNLDIGLVKKTLAAIAKHIGIENASDLVSPNLPFIFWNWHEQFGNVSSFPWSVLGFPTEGQFYSSHVHGLVPVLVHRRDLPGLQQMAGVLGQPVCSLFEVCFPALLGSILPRFADESQQQTATIIISTVEQHLGDETVKSLLESKVGDIIMNIISHLHDPEQLKSLNGQSMPELPDQTKLCFSSELVLGGLQYIQENTQECESPILVYLSQKKPRLVQKMLLKLYRRISQTKLPEFKLQWTHQFVLLCEMVAQVTAHPQYQLTRYTVCWVLRVLLHLVSDQRASSVGLVAAVFLHRFLSTVVSAPKSAAALDSLLPLITTSLVPLADQTSTTGKEVLRVLELLLVDHSDCLPGVATVQPLPPDPMFANMTEVYRRRRYAAPLSDSLQAEIQHVLNNRCGSRQTEGLRHLRSQLSEKKIELAGLYKELEAIRGFSEDCEKSILHQLICMLIQATSSPDPKVGYEAVCCLGELGPADLTTLVLKPETLSPLSHPLAVLLEKLLRYLHESLFDADVAVIQSTSDALYALFLNFSQQLKELLTREQMELFLPFMPPKRQRKVVAVDDGALADVVKLFCPQELCSFTSWVTQVVTALLNVCQLSFLIPICSLKEDLCKELLPLIVDLILHQSKRKSAAIDLFIDQINTFFSHHQKDIPSDEIYNNHDAVISMLSVVHIIRKHGHHERKVNYLDSSRAALSCSAYFTCVLFAELWASEYNRDREDLDSEGVSQFEFIEDRDNVNGQLLQSLLREAYIKIGEPDAVYGCGNSHLMNLDTQIQHYEYEGRWSSVVEACDVQLSLNPTNQFQGLESALHYSGLYQLAGKVSPGSYEACWRLCQWGLPGPGEEDRQSHDGLVYTALRALHHSNTQRTLQVVGRARHLLAERLAHTGLEAATNVYTVLSRLQALQEVEDYVTQDFSLVAEKWKQQDKIGWHKFTLAEPIFAQRMTLMRLNQTLNQEVCAEVLIRATEAAKMEGFNAVAHSWLSTVSSLYSPPGHLQHSIELLQAQIFWDKQEPYTARHILRRLLGQLRDSDLDSLYAKALQTYGSWAACTRLEHTQQILDKYLIPAVEISDDSFKITSAFSLARYADAEYQTLLSYVKSPAYTDKMKHISESIVNAQKLTKAAAEVSKQPSEVMDKQARIDLHKTLNMHDKQSKIDQVEVENTQKELDNYLILAVKHYMIGLEIGDVKNLSIFRVVSLWLSNYNHQELQEELASYMDSIPSHKVLPVLPQLVARISDSTADLSTSLLHQLIERCARDHPHHVLPLVMALANSYRDTDYCQSSLQTCSKPEARVIGAQKMLSKLKQGNLKCLVKDMQTVAESYISLANCSHSSDKATKVYKIPKSEPITKLKSISHMLCPTVTLPVRQSGDYSSIVGIERFEETYSSVGGINEPKKISCVCSDGTKRPQLVKGNDDLRQDAVMQQVFTIMNSLLRENKETRKRRLLIRTYKVVPLSQRSGVIEWCSNTVPLSMYLIGGGGVVGAHTRYRPQDLSPAVSRKKIGDAAKCSYSERLAVFKEVCANFKPVFRHFFYENFTSPGIWFERKLAYTHSVATSSMVGYILGLGDRHILNILLDEHTAEVIHIDFGIAFEQGLTLRTPETVPFRLTRDIVDGMGVSGIEGVFRRSCEKTMMVLRECESTILTILEVLLYDPLYMWTIKPELKTKRPKQPQSQPSQAPPEGEVNKLAERALLRLKQKLQGIEEGSTTSIEGQVSKLVQEATDPVNLSRLFHGWQAHV